MSNIKINKVIIAGDKSMAEMPEDLNEAFKSLGHQSSFYHFYYNKLLHKLAWFFTNTPFRLTKNIGGIIMNYATLDINNKFIDYVQINKPEFVIIINGFSLKEDTILRLRNNGTKIVNWVVDDPARARFSNFSKALTCYDVIFCCSKNWLKYAEILSKDIIYLPLAVNPNKYTKNKKTDYKFDICFIGTFTENDSSSYFRYSQINHLINQGFKVRVAGKNADRYFEKNKINLTVGNQISISEALKIYSES